MLNARGNSNPFKAQNQQENTISEIYIDDLENVDVSFRPNYYQFSDVDIVNFEIVPKAKKAKSIEKILLQERIAGVWGGGGSPYLEHNAQTEGDYDYKRDLQYKINIVNQCRQSVVWMRGESTGLHYVKQLDCRKQWCPDCGGPGGRIHKARLHSILKRLDLEKYNIRQFVLTIPESLRDKLQNRENLNYIIKASKRLVEHFFGIPILDKYGYVKKYQLDHGVIQYLHLFGDREQGIYKPHVNIHIFENRLTRLKLTEEQLDRIKKYWLKKLKYLNDKIETVDIHYKFRITKRHKLHALKYMSRPWSKEDFDACDIELKKFLVEELSGFQYLRFWGSLANCNYKDDLEIKDQVNEATKKAGENMIVLGVGPFNAEAWKNRMVKVDDGLYIIINGGKNKNGEECKAN